ncbi:aldehyde dehydrogenase family protein [Kitasatospora sp. NPDC056181]|uniref:aldehyde dehydrogenase family protein n=1 Tax=Kitasatospora sp. NPDC056181 TaxID=3345737 RepID=UPI0035D59CEB
MSASVPARTHWIGGTRTTGHTRWIDVVDPATEERLSVVPAGTAADADLAVAAAVRAFGHWSGVPLRERVDAVRAVAKGLAARQDEIAAAVTAEVGVPTVFSQRVQASLPVAVASGAAAVAEDFAWTEQIGRSTVFREPVGVVAAITPWNFPLHQAVAKVAPALLAGNTVVLKPSEIAPLTAMILAEVVRGAGVPDGVLNVVHGRGPEVGAALASHPVVDMVSFTGSTGAGRSVAALGARTVKRVALELGGKSANLVLPDADLLTAVRAGVANCFMNNGQMCWAWTRLLVPAALHDQAVEAAAEAAAAFTVGDPTLPGTRIGPLASAAQRDRVRGYIERGIADGARLAAGGPTPPDGLDRGYYVRPTVFAGVSPTAVIAQEEIFGPVLSVIPYSSEDEAVSIANGTRYGLGGAVFSADPDRALAVARRLRTGQVDINGAAFNEAAPFGGYRQSGNGRELGRFGLEEFCEVKSIQRSASG